MKNLRHYLVILITVITATQSLWSLDLPVRVYDKDLDLPLEGVRIQEIETGIELYTDFNGEAVITLPELERAILLIELVGYETKKQLITDFSTTLDIYMLMEGVLEGEELVVEVDAIGETDAEVGVSTVVQEEVIQSAAKIGVIEDAMAAVKILPGVTYSGGMASNLSIRGSEFSGFSAIMDGMKVNFPFHFGGVFSIFNPNIVESIKFSPGIFSVKHGEATSALLEVNTITPDDGTKYSIVTSTITAEAFYQTQLGKNKNMGLLGGLRLTFLEPTMRFQGWVADMTDEEDMKETISSFSTFPYIYDFYFKTYYKPSESFNWYFNAFSGNDAIGFQTPELSDQDKNKEVLEDNKLEFQNNDLVLNTGINLMPTEKLLVNFMVGQEVWNISIDMKNSYEGTYKYSEEFKSVNSITSDSAYIKLDKTDVESDQVRYSTQTRLDFDLSPNDKLLLQTGVGTTFETSTWKSKGFNMFFSKTEGSDVTSLQKKSFDDKGDGDKNLSTFIYTNLNAEIFRKLSLETGIRLDHFYQDTESKDIADVNTGILPAPRARLTFTPGINSSIFNNNCFTLGVGLFNMPPWKSGNGDTPEKSLMSVLGWDTHIPFDMHFKVEGYYKYIYDRTYTNTHIYNDPEKKDIVHTNGYGHVAGADLLLERKISRYIDGMLSYTYVWGRYKDPTLESGYEYNINREAPRGEYYWPDFHRFHSLNLLFDVKPTNNFKITTKFTFASGLPKRKFKNTPKSEVLDADGKLVPVEMNDSKNLYSDSNRTEFELPLDIKFTWHNYKPGSKYNWEFYIALEDVLNPFLKHLKTDPSKNASMMADRKEDEDNSFDAPMPSIGFRLTF